METQTCRHPQATSGYNHANGGWPCSLHEIQEQRAQKVPHRLQLFDVGDPHGHGSVLRLLLHAGIKHGEGDCIDQQR